MKYFDWVCSPLVLDLAAIFTAVATVMIAALAIWGDSLKALFVGPRLMLSLRDPGGNPFRRMDGSIAIYYHLTVTNSRRRLAFHRTPLQQVRVFLSGLAKRGPDGTFSPLQLVYPLQLFWTPSEFREPFRTVVDEEVADFGCLVQNSAFTLQTLVRPDNFPGDVTAGEAVRFEIKASGPNAFSPEALILEVAWDGEWSSDKTERQRHLVVKPVPALR